MSLSNSMLLTDFCEQPLPQLTEEVLTQEIQIFDYTFLTSEVQTFVRCKTCEIKSLMRLNAQNIIDIGEKLIEVKEQLGHGNFRAWLRTEFACSARTAARFMKVATQFKGANLAHLSITASALYF